MEIIIRRSRSGIRPIEGYFLLYTKNDLAVVKAYA